MHIFSAKFHVMNVTAETMSKRHEAIMPFIHRTPVLTSSFFNHLTGSSLYFKCENFQRMGAFKMRGAASAMVTLSENEKRRGVVTHSSGNFAQAVSLAANGMGIRAYIVMPENAPEVKKSAVRGYGGEITLCASTLEAREEACQKIIRETGATFLHPSNDLDVIIGQGTAAKELLEDIEDLDILIAPVGGGGLIAGTALAAFFYGTDCEVVGAEPALVDDAYRSLQSGRIETNSRTDTIADGLRTILGDINFPIIQRYVKEIIRVEEADIIPAMKLVYERMKIIIEPSCAVPVAAIIHNQDIFRNKKTGVILSGGNVDINNLPF
jgi:threonine dehydratase